MLFLLEKAPEFSVNSAIEKAEISDFDEESSILDAHLHEQKIVDEESALATAETYIALNVFPDSRALSGEKSIKSFTEIWLTLWRNGLFPSL